MRQKAPKYQVVVAAVREKIRSREYPAGMRLPGQFALANEHGVSAITANRALNELRDMGLVERRERSGTFVLDRPRLLTRIALVFEAMPREYLWLGDMLSGIAEAAERDGITTEILRPSDPLFDERSRRGGDGLGAIMLGIERPEATRRLLAAGVPVVVAGMEARIAKHCVLADLRRAGRELTARLSGAGCRHIGFVGTMRKLAHRLTYEGYVEELVAAGRELGPRCDTDEKRAAGATAKLLAARRTIDGLIVTGGSLPFAVLPVLLEQKRRPALGIIAESEVSLQLRRLAYIAAYDRLEIGRLAVELLNDVACGRVRSTAVRHPPLEILAPES